MEKIVRLLTRPVAILIAFVLTVPAQTPPPEHSALDDQRVATLSGSLTSDELVNLIMSAPEVHFDLSPGSLDALMKAGVSEVVIKAMAARANGKPTTPASASAENSPLRAPVAEAAASVAAAPVAATPAAAAPVALTVTTPMKPAAHAAHSGNSYNVTYDGGSVPNLKAGMGLKLFIDSDRLVLERSHNEVLTILPASVTEISYGQDVHRRIGAAIGLALVSFGIGALMALTKSKKHYVGLTWASGEQKGGFAMQCDKHDYRGVLAGLEGVTGKKAVDTDTLTVKN
jgi:hypothetical protein